MVNPEDNALFAVLSEGNAEDVLSLYENDRTAANPKIVPEKPIFRHGFFAHQSNQYLADFDYQVPHYKDGLLETETTYLTWDGTPILFSCEAEDREFLCVSTEFTGQAAFAGNKYYDWGWIQLTDSRKNGCYRALYEPLNNVLYTLPSGYEMSRLEHNATARLYQLNEAGIPVNAWNITLKQYPCMSMVASNILYPWEEDKISCDVQPVKKNGKMLIPFRAVFEHLFADVTEDANTMTATKAGHTFEVTAGCAEATMDGKTFAMQLPAAVVSNRLMVSLDAVKAFFDITVEQDEAKNLIRFLKERPYWDKWGKIENSYTTVPITSAASYPEYLKDEAAQSVEDIQNAADLQSVHIAFMTDIHYTPCENDHIRLERTLNAYRDIAAKIDIDGMALGGDRIFEACKEIRTKAIEEYRSHFHGIRYFPVCGNHDPGVQWDGYVLGGVAATNRFTKQEMFRGMYDHLPAENAVFNPEDPEDQLYYYLDKSEDKVRYIFLDSSDAPQTLDDSGRMVYNPIGHMAFSQKQMDWLAKTALNMPEEGWTVLIFAHHIVDPELAADYEMTIQKNRYTLSVVTLLDAYKAGGNLQGTLYRERPDFALELNYDFSQYHRAQIAGVVMGHTHTDYVKYSETGIPYIHTACAYVDNVFCQADAPPRTNGTKAEVLFDVITISKSKKMLYLTRVGAGENRTVSYE